MRVFHPIYHPILAQQAYLSGVGQELPFYQTQPANPCCFHWENGFYTFQCHRYIFSITLKVKVYKESEEELLLKTTLK